MSRHPREPLAPPYRLGQILAAEFLQLRLVVEEFQLRWPARLEQIDHTFRLGREMRAVPAERSG